MGFKPVKSLRKASKEVIIKEPAQQKLDEHTVQIDYGELER